MAKLEDLTRGASVKGIIPDGLSTKSVDFSAEAVYFMRVLAGCIRPVGKRRTRISRYSTK